MLGAGCKGQGTHDRVLAWGRSVMGHDWVLG